MKKILWVVTFFIAAGLTNTYAQSNKNSLADKLLIVVHMQDAFSKKVTKESTQDEMDNINQIIRTVNPEQVVYLIAMHKILNLTLKKIYVEEQVKDLDDRLDVVNENVFVDHGGDIFSSNDLTEYLKQNDIHKIVIVGRLAEECIKTSILSGIEKGYDLYIVPDAIVGKSEKSKLKTIRKLKEKGAKELNII